MCLLGCLGSIGSFSLHFFLHFCHGAKKICEVVLQQAWCFVCVLEFQFRKKEKSNVQAQHVVERTQNKVVLFNVNCYKSAYVWGVWVTCLYSVLPPLKKKHLWIAMWCFRPLKFFIFPNLWPPNSIWDMSNKKKSWSYLDLLTRNDACLEKVTQVHILPTWWWKIMMIYLGRIRKKVNKQTNPKLHSTTRFQPWSWCEPSASLQWFGWNIPLM